MLLIYAAGLKLHAAERGGQQLADVGLVVDDQGVVDPRLVVAAGC
jgi:hypothetical protein